MAYIGSRPADKALTSDDIADGIISTAKIANDAVDASKLDETDNYSFTGTITGAGSLVKLSTATATGSEATIEFNVFSDSYDAYKIVGSNILPTTNDRSLECRFLNTSDSVISAALKIMKTEGRTGGTPSTSMTGSDNATDLSPSGTSTSNLHTGFVMDVMGARQTGYTNIIYQGVNIWASGTSEIIATDIQGTFFDTSVLNGIQFVWNASSNFVSGSEFVIYGYGK
tara:strand:+ start:10 stop:690 length:681 start_codon:yes stop_codon:yes gene_type:complete